MILAKKNKYTLSIFCTGIKDKTLTTRTDTISSNNYTLGKIIPELVSNPTTENLLKRENTIIDKKIREGYVELDQQPPYNFVKLWNQLDNDSLTNSLGYTLPMKAYPFTNDTMTYPCLAQRKLNGIRGDLSFQITKGNDLFDNEEKLSILLRDKTGNTVDIPHISKHVYTLYEAISLQLLDLNEDTKALEIIFDGEFYIHGLPLGQINGAVHNSDNKNHKDLVFVIFDIKIKAEQIHRIEFIQKLSKRLNLDSIQFNQTVVCNSDDEALQLREQYISEGYEGVILRKSDALYQKGRTHDMLKYKALKKILCLIVDVVPYKKDPTQGMFKVMDVTNDTVIESVIKSKKGNTTEIRKEVIINSQYYIGKYVMIEYRERTENGKLFHTNAIFEEIQTNYNN